VAIPEEVDVAIVGAGPAGLTLANLLGMYGLRTAVFEQFEELVDYPRAVGMDDECLRVFQAAGIAETIVPHTIPNQWLRFLTKGGRCFAAVEPLTDEFGWPRRNGFIQPLVDQALLRGTKRFPNVSVHFAHRMTALRQSDDDVDLDVESPSGTASVRARYVVGADGGRSEVRKSLGIAFAGKTDSTRWLVLDIARDPIGTPNAYCHCDPARPTVSIGLPHAVRRFEFMIFANETDAEMSTRERLNDLMRPYVAEPERVDVIRARVYTHHARLAARFRQGRAMLIGDAAHLMPVWQGQGFNSGIRDASNLAWKLAAVCRGRASDRILDTYEEERREHARAMISISVLAGKLFSPTNPILAWTRDVVTLMLNAVPPAKRYVLQMRFKPMPKYLRGAIVPPRRNDKTSPVGKLFIQPLATTPLDPKPERFDTVIGPWFAVVAWGIDPTRTMSTATRAFWERLGARFVMIKPPVQFAYTEDVAPETLVVGDVSGRLKDWFGRHDGSVVILRPDRFVAALTTPQDLDTATARFAAAMSALPATREAVPAVTAMDEAAAPTVR
jgi:3-(3-hydroxy-phenyl)propionate hydroxylase